MCVFWVILDVGQSKGERQRVVKRGSAPGSQMHTNSNTHFSGCCGMFGAVPRQIRAMPAVFDGQPGQTRPARHKLLRHMMSRRTYVHTHAHTQKLSRARPKRQMTPSMKLKPNL